MNLWDAYAELLAAKVSHPDDWQTRVDPELMQWMSARWFEADRDTPAKVWSQATYNHSAIYKFLRIDPAESAARYAIEPFRVHTDPDTGKARILVAYPCPRLVDAFDEHTVIETVLSWNPTSGSVTVLRDPSPQLFGGFTDTEQGTIFRDPFAFFRAWVESRAAWFVDYLSAIGRSWQVKPIERDLVPGCLMVGDIEAIQWAPHSLPTSLNCVGVDPKALNRAILKAARLPFASSDNIRRAA